jgi:MAF protein
VDERAGPARRQARGGVALDKARVAAARAGEGVVIAADTIVVLGDTVLGKPADKRDAERMLAMLSGGMHRVITGLAVMDASTGKSLTAASVTRVWFRDLTRDEIVSYVNTGEPLDKAGAYGIQEKGALVEKIEGCYFNVVGLPLTLRRTAEKFRDQPDLIIRMTHGETCCMKVPHGEFICFLQITCYLILK